MKKFLSLLLTLTMVLSLSVFAFAAENPATPFDNSEFFTVGDYTLHYRVFEPQGTAKNQLFLVHGFGLSTVSLEPVAKEYVNNGYKVVLVDMPNFGYSSRETAETTLVDRESLAYELMTSLSGDKWIVGGHSMGGGIAINIATDHPETVSGLVLFAPQTSSELVSPMDKFVRSGVVKAIFNMLIKFASKSKLVIKMMVEMSFSDANFAKNYDLSKISDPLKIENTGAGIAIMSSHARGTDFDKLATLTMPTVIVTCSNDKVASADNLKMIIDNAPKGATVCNVEQGGHMMMEFAPAQVAALTMSTIESA